MKNPYEPILKEVANGMLETAEFKQNFSNNAFIDAVLIFQTLLMDKLFDNQNFDNMPMAERYKMAEACGEQLRRLIHTFTGLETCKLIEDYETNRNTKK